MKKSEMAGYMDFIFNSIREAVILTNLKGEITRMNRSAEKLTGWSTSEAAGKLTDQIIQIFDVETGKESLLTDESGHKKLISRDGQERIIDMESFPVEGDKIQNDGIVIIIHDKTEEYLLKKEIADNSKQYRESVNGLRASLDSFRLIADFTYDWEYFVDADKRFIYVSPSCERLTGLTPEDFYRNDVHIWENIIHPDDQQLFQEHLKSEHGAGDVSSMDLRIIRTDGQIIWVNHVCQSVFGADGKFLGRRASNRDITSRKQAEQVTLNIERRYRSLIEYAPDGVVLIDIDGKFKYASPSVERIFGYIQEDLPLYNSASLTHPDDVPMVLMELTKLIGDASYKPTLQYRFRHKNGEWRWIESTFSNLLSVPDVEGIIINFRDIHERKLAETELEKSRELLKEAQRVGHIGHMEWTINDHSMTCSDELYRILGLEPQSVQITQKTFASMVSQEEGERLIRLEQQIFENRSDLDYEFCVTLSTGEQRWLHQYGNITYSEDGTPIHMISTVQDITDHKKAEITLHESENKYRSVINSMNDTVWLLDYDLSILDVNNTATTLLGYSREELLSMKIFGIDINLAEGEIQDLASSMPVDKVQVFETAHRTKSGKIIPVEISSSLVPYNGRTIILSIARDITERKHAEKALKESEEKFRKAFMTSPDAININRIEDGAYIAINQGFTDITGFTEVEVIGKSSLDLDIWEDPEDRKRLVVDLNKNGFVENLDARFRMKSGEIRYGLMSASVIMLDDSPHILSVTRDITDRKLALDALVKSEEKYRLLFERVKNGYSLNEIITDIEGNAVDYIILEVNMEFEKIFGIERKDIVRKRWSELKSRPGTEWQKRLRIVGEAALNGTEGEFEFLHDVTDRTYNVHIYSPARNLFAAIYEDITERKNIEGALRQVQDKYFAVFNSQTEMTLLTELSDRGVPGKILEANDCVIEITGYSRDEIMKIKPSDLSAYPLSKTEDVAKQLLVGNTATFEQTIKCRDGRQFPAEIVVYKIISGGGTYAIISAHDITDLKKSEKEAESSRRLMNALMENVPVGVTIADSDMNIIWRSQAGEIIPGFTIMENVKNIIQKTPIYYPDKKTIVPYEELPIVKAARDDIMVENMEVALLKDGGSSVDFSCNAVAVRDSSGVIIGSIMTYQDITTIKKREQEIFSLNTLLVKRTEELEDSNKELEAFSYSVSHDLRAPLRHISGFTNLLAERCHGNLDPESESYLTRVNDAVNMMSKLIDDLLKLSRITRVELNIQRICLSELFRSVSAEKMKESSDRTADIIINDNLFADCDAALMKICINGLFDNSWKFTSKNRNAEIEFGEVKSNGRACFFIRDNGVGFDIEHVDKIFGAFQRLHSTSEFEGTGIGLAIVQRIINKHGGSIWAESEINKGTTFYFILND